MPVSKCLHLEKNGRKDNVFEGRFLFIPGLEKNNKNKDFF